jgi:hypothetical protein
LAGSTETGDTSPLLGRLNSLFNDSKHTFAGVATGLGGDVGKAGSETLLAGKPGSTPNAGSTKASKWTNVFLTPEALTSSADNAFCGIPDSEELFAFCSASELVKKGWHIVKPHFGSSRRTLRMYF